MEHGKPLVYDNGKKGIRLDGFTPEVVNLEGDASVDDCLVYDEHSQELASIMSRMFWKPELPRPFGVFYREERKTYEDMMQAQIDQVMERKGRGDLQALLNAGETWTIE